MGASAIKKDFARGTRLLEKNGEIVEATELVLVLDENESPVFAKALAESGVPQPGDSLGDDENVVVEEREPRIKNDKSATAADVEIMITYRRQRPDTESDLAVRGGASITQEKTHVDKDGNAIKVTYDGDTVRKPITVPVVQGNFVRERKVTTDDPDAVVAGWINHINSTTFRGQAAREWLVTRVDYERVTRSGQQKEYRFEFAFERRPSQWVYTVAFTDENGDVPSDVVDGTGIKDIKWHPEKDFTAEDEHGISFA